MSQSTLVAIKPTLFFVQDGHQLRQLVRVIIANGLGGGVLSLRIECEHYREQSALSGGSASPTTHLLYLPDLRQPTLVTFQLLAGDSVQDEQTLCWQPQKHWEVHLVHYIHHDLGYTDIPT